MKSIKIKTTGLILLLLITALQLLTGQEVTPFNPTLSDTMNEDVPDPDDNKFDKYFYLVHYYDRFTKPYTLNWHLTSLQAKFKSDKITYMGFVNYGQVLNETSEPFGKADMQYRLDVYPIFSENSYAYLSYAFSQSPIFPSHQARGVFYYQFGKGFETSAGLYYMQWEKPYYIYTGSIAKYHGSYWFSLRPYLQVEEGTIYQSYLLFARKYIGSPEDFLNLMIGYGSSPENQAYFYQYEDIYKLNSFNIQLNIQKKFEQWIILLGSGVKFEEYTTDDSRYHWHWELGISYKL